MHYFDACPSSRQFVSFLFSLWTILLILYSSLSVLFIRQFFDAHARQTIRRIVFYVLSRSAVTSGRHCETDATHLTSGGNCSSILTVATKWWLSGNERIRTTSSTRSGSAVCRLALVCKLSGRGLSKKLTSTKIYRRCLHTSMGHTTVRYKQRTRRTCSVCSSNVERRKHQRVVQSSTLLAGSTCTDVYSLHTAASAELTWCY